MRYLPIFIGIAVALSSCRSLKSTTRSHSKDAGSISRPGNNSIDNNTAGPEKNTHEDKLPVMPERRAPPRVVFIAPFNIEFGDPLQFKYAIKMNVEVERLANADLYRFIESWWGTPYKMGGATQKGVDCSAFTQTLISIIYGQQIPRTANEQRNFCTTIDITDLKEGDMVFFNTKKGRGITHVGIYLQQDQFVHASSSEGVRISNLNEGYWSKRFVCAGRAVDEKISAAGN